MIKQDKVYSYFKFDRKSNYKPDLCNSLGIFEQPETFALIHTTLTTISNLRTNPKDFNFSIIESHFETYQKLLVEWNLEAKLDCGLRYSKLTLRLHEMVVKTMGILRFIDGLTKIDRKDGMPAEDVA